LAPRQTDARPVLVRVGKHLIDPTDVAAITQVKKGLWVIRLKSQPDMKYPAWAEEDELEKLLEQFNILECD